MLSLLRPAIAALAVILGTMTYAHAESVAFPADAGFLNVHDFGAKGDGVTDDTAAIKAALTASGGDTGQTFWRDRIVYFPGGTYLVSAPIMKRYADGRFGSGSILIGQSRDTTVIRLKDRAAGYDDSSHPQAVIFTTAKLLDGTPTSGGKDYTGKGEGNDAYMNYVENMTIDVGAGNPGAIGIDYLANNMGAIRNVLVRAGDGSGVTGIALTRKWPGPALLQDVTVQGFDTGIDAANTEYGVTLEHIMLENQRRTGLINDHNMLAVHNLSITDAPLPIANQSPDGLIVIDGGKIGQAIQGGEAIHNDGYLNLRDMHISGYKTVLGVAAIPLVDGVYDANKRLSPAQETWSLPVKDPPSPPVDAVEKWISVGAPPDAKADSTESIRKAFASGARTIYFPHGTYLISDNIIVPASVQRIVGMTSTIHVHPAQHLRRDQGMFRAMNNVKPLTIEKLAFDNSYLGDQVGVEAAGTEPIVLRDVVGAGVITLLRPETGGEAFIENTCCGTVSVVGDKGVWVRQLNTEGPGVRIRNQGAPLWILGIKTEGDCTVLENTAGARTEILGGLIYITGAAADPAIPAFRNTDARLLLSYVEESFNPQATYDVHLMDMEKGVPHLIDRFWLPRRNIGRIVPKLVSRYTD